MVPGGGGGGGGGWREWGQGYGTHLKFSIVDFICFNPSRLFNFNENLLPVKHVLYKSKVNIQKNRRLCISRVLSLSLSFISSSSTSLEFLLSLLCYVWWVNLFWHPMALLSDVTGEFLLASCRFTEWWRLLKKIKFALT